MLIVVIVSCGLSITGSLLNLLSTTFMKPTDQLLFRFIQLISLLDLILAVFELITTSSKIFSLLLCQLLDCISAFGLFGSVIVTCCFSHYILLSVKRGGHGTMSGLMDKYVIISGLATASLVIFRFFTTNYTISDGVCITLLPGKQGIDWLFMLRFAIPVFAAVIFCAVCCLLTFKKIREISGQKHYGLAFYPLIIVVCIGPLVTLGLRNQLFSDKGSFSWLLIANFMLYLQGFLNSLAYGVYKRITIFFVERCFSVKTEQNELTPADEEETREESYDQPLIVNA